MSDRRVALVAAMIGALGAIAAAIITVLLPETCHRGGGEASAASKPPARTASGDRRAATMPGLLAEFWNVPPLDREPQPPGGAPTATRADVFLEGNR